MLKKSISSCITEDYYSWECDYQHHKPSYHNDPLHPALGTLVVK